MEKKKSLWFTLAVLLIVLLAFGFFALPLFSSSFRPVLLPSGRVAGTNAVVREPEAADGYSVQTNRIYPSGEPKLLAKIQDAVILPDEILLFHKYPSGKPKFAVSDLRCLFYAKGSIKPVLNLSPITGIDGQDPDVQIVRCPLPTRGYFAVALHKGQTPAPVAKRWDWLVYEAVVDATDNATVVFAKGMNLRWGRPANPVRFECVYLSNFDGHRFIRSPAVSAAHEVVRCPTPPPLLRQPRLMDSMKVSVNIKGRDIMDTVARPSRVLPMTEHLSNKHRKGNRMCVCTMLRNQARFLKEWVMYHGRIGVDRWFIYDNNSDDDIELVLESLAEAGYRVSRHAWPWIKSQEAGFAHCAIRARDTCEWVGFIDIDEFLLLPTTRTLNKLLNNYSDKPNVGELRTSCLNFGPSGRKHSPAEGITVGYTCRTATPERHKSIVRPEALSPTLMNVVHHFHLKEGYSYANVDMREMVINHYKYQVWEVFKEKFVRRVSTYVADWRERANEGSNDRAPGLGTEAVEPADWPSRFCEVKDITLRNWVLKEFRDPDTGLLPWQKCTPSDSLRQIGE